MVPPLPIDPHLPEALGLLEKHRALVLVAAPGAGKTTRVPPALLRASWLNGRILLLQPRRVAARAAARRIASEHGWHVGREVGYRIRFERHVSESTRIEVVTEGVLLRQLQADPLLEQVGAVVLDEFHERSIYSDLALALLKEVQRAREDLRVIVMSATLDPSAVVAYLDNCPSLTVQSPQHRVQIVYARRRRQGPLEPAVVTTVRRALVEDPQGGDLLVFLPGVAEIRRVREGLDLPDLEVLSLHGSLPSAEQDHALQRGDRRRVVLATNVAETSVTVEGVSAVVDAGLARIPRFDPARGIDNLELTRISCASADQRAGRAGRLGPGRVYRLWTTVEHASLPKQTRAEVRRVDLTRVVLELHAWGSDPQQFDWFEAPEPGALQQARRLLQRLGALDTSGSITLVGRDLLRWPIHPRLARMLQLAQQHGLARAGATIAALLTERDILRTHQNPAADLPTARSDVLLRMELLDLAERARFHPSSQCWTDIDLTAARQVARVRDDLLAQLGTQSAAPRAAGPALAELEPEAALLSLILTAYPDRVARRREPGSPRGLMVGGRGVILDRSSVVRDEPLFVALWLEGSGREARVRLASAVEEPWLATHEDQTCCFDADSGRVIAQRQILLEDLCLQAHPCSPDPERAAELLAQAARKDPICALEPDQTCLQFLARLQWLRREAPELGLPAGDSRWLEEQIPALCLGKTSLAELRREPLLQRLRSSLTAHQLHTLDTQAPERIRLPSGRLAALTYHDSGPPLLAAQLQELFGLAETPHILGGRVQLLIDLLGPNHRPVQRTRDLRSFWNTTYPQVRKELRRRYPKHAWPEDPWSAIPTRRPSGRRAKK